MGLGKFIKHIVLPGSFTADVVVNILEEGGSVSDGIARAVKEEFTENIPITKMFYTMGKTDGMKEGYVKASDKYERKLLELADEFINQRKDFVKERDEYEDLLNEYEKVIIHLSEKVDRTQAENMLLQEFLLRERKLKALIA